MSKIMPVLRWGIAGAGKISDDFAGAVRALSRQEHEIVAIAARDSVRAGEFAKKFSITTAYGSYEELSRDPDVDVVYVGTINTTHYQICKLMLENNKHVLCEKSLTLLLKHTEELIKLAAEKKKFFQEAVWSRFFPAYERLREALAGGRIGDVKLITINLCRRFKAEKREVGSGALMSLGVYPLQLVLAACGPEMPEKVQASGTLNEDGVDLSSGITLIYKNGTIAQLSLSFVLGPDDRAYIHGTKGSITFSKKFYCPTDITINGQTETFPYPILQVPLEQIKRPGFVYQVQEVRDCIEKGLLESPRMTHQETIVIARIFEEIKSQIGLTFSDLYEE